MLESHRALDAAPEFSDSPAYRLDAPSPTQRALEADLDAVVHAIVSARKDAESLSPFRHARTRTATPGASASRRDEGKWSWSARAAALWRLEGDFEGDFPDSLSCTCAALTGLASTTPSAALLPPQPMLSGPAARRSGEQRF